MTSNLPGPTFDLLMRTKIQDMIREQRFCEVSQTPLVVDDAYLVQIVTTGEEILVSSRGLKQLAIDPEDMVVISAATGMPVK